MANKKKILLRDNAKLMARIAILVAVFFGQLFRLNFAIDTYYNFWIGFEKAAEDTIRNNYRYVIAFFYRWFAATNYENEVFYYISYGIAIIFLSLSVFIYSWVIGRYSKSVSRCVLFSFMSIVNVFIIEYFMFIEKGAFMVGIFFNVCIVLFIQRFIETKHIWYLPLCFVMMGLTLVTYQGIICLYFILLLPIVFYNSKNILQYIGYMLLMSSIYIIPSVIELYMFQHVSESDRAGGLSIKRITDRIEYARWVYRDSMVNTFDIIPRHFYVVILVMLIIISVVVILFRDSNKFLRILNIAVIMAACTIMPLASVIMATGWNAPRIIYPMASSVGVLAVNFEINVYNKVGLKKLDKTIRFGIWLIVFTLGFVQYVGFQKIITDRFQSNYADKMRYLEIGEAIKIYEEKTGIEIKEVVFYRDANHDYPYYPEINDYSDLAISAFHSWDSQLTALNYYLHTDYKRGMLNQWFAQYYADHDWHTYSPQQIEFIDDKLMYCVY